MRSDPAPAGPSLQIFRDQAEKSVLFVGDSSSEINSRAERKEIPQAINLEWRGIGFFNRLNESAGCQIVIVDSAVAKISDPQLALHQCESPRCVEITIRNQTSQEVAAGIKYINKAVARTSHVILALRILQRVGNVNPALATDTDIANAKWRVTGRQVRVDETVRINLLKILVVGLNAPGMEICHIQKIMAIGDAQCRALINGAFTSQVRSIINRDNCMRTVQCRIPARDGTVFADEDE